MDPITQQLSKAALDKLAKPEKPARMPLPAGQESPFQQILSQQLGTNDTTSDSLMQMVDETFGASKKGVQGVDASTVEVAFDGSVETKGKGFGSRDAVGILEHLNSQQNQMEQLLASVSSGQKLTMQDMLQAQMITQRAGGNLEIFSKFMEQALKIPNTLFNMQLG